MHQLIKVVDSNWSEIADNLQLIENLYEDKSFTQREAAAYLCSKIYYHLEELDDSLSMAVNSGKYFDLDERSHFTESLVSNCIERYIEYN